MQQFIQRGLFHEECQRGKWTYNVRETMKPGLRQSELDKIQRL